MPFMTGPSSQPRDVGFHPPFTSLMDARSRSLPQVISYSPNRGIVGSKLYVHIQSTYDLTNQQPPIMFTAMYGNKRCPTALSKRDSDEQFYRYALSSEIPSFDETGQHDTTTVPLILSMDDEYGQSLGVVEVGDFTYAPTTTYQQFQPVQDHSKKRKVSAESADFMRSSTKRHAGQPLHPRYVTSPNLYQQAQSLSPVTPFLQPSTPTAPGFAYQSGYTRPQQSMHFDNRRQSEVLYQYPASSITSQSGIKAPSPNVPPLGYSPYSASSQPARSPSMTSSKVTSRDPGIATSAILANPPLIRTTTLQANSAAVSGDKMAEDWSREEWDAKRRLVHFKRSQSGSTITASFSAVTPEEKPPNCICISCIWWEEKNDCFVTSVDTIYLLESLVGVRFTVEEKNRIRRNLEGFRPLTVSKAKAESEEFFKVIMGFPNPKPRNIEKDVKVFPWKILPHALKKIISKYSASYSSTAGALLPPVSNGQSGAVASQPTGQRRAASPRPTRGSATSNIYRSNMSSTGLLASPKVSGGLDLSMSAASGPNVRVAVPQLGGSMANMSQWQTGTGQYGPTFPSNSRTTSFDFTAYFDPRAGTVPTTATATNGMPMYHSRAEAILPESEQQMPQMGGEEEFSHVEEGKSYQTYGQRTSRA
ncbi:hypothetical protein M501DRAFT_195099 [Patellaria atrata CBS 101060]|uniref:DUF7082 domain-containing protein n=1 Tax=Patellaria atrata CBS 101060 TaxID=1346257 RepID=A0A9P4S6V1_9PEZI|nr:hypothetical protein M501DRAFT_195099 [Patellaria atrata CBS 101060]